MNKNELKKISRKISSNMDSFIKVNAELMKICNKGNIYLKEGKLDENFEEHKKFETLFKKLKDIKKENTELRKKIFK